MKLEPVAIWGEGVRYTPLHPSTPCYTPLQVRVREGFEGPAIATGPGVWGRGKGRLQRLGFKKETCAALEAAQAWKAEMGV